MGVGKITPAHDPNDFEVGNRHNLERIIVMNPDATMNENAFKYQGMTREECREKLLDDLKEQGLLLNIEPMTHSVGHSERTGVMVEPYLSKQWFVKMRPLADHVLENQNNKETKVNFVPERYEKTMNHWMEITYDWCISRQLWWGHRIPAWYKDDEIYVGIEAPKEEGWIQDNDVLDTWFSSALWPFSTLGWPNETEDMKRYFPNDCLVTGYDIIPFWVNRMTFQSLELNNVRPFKDCVIHGLIRDKEGRKMSKSLGNGIDPFDMIDKYGCDALRYYLCTDCALGTDLRFDETKMASTWNYINKIWNASRFVLMNIDALKGYDFTNLSKIDKWILTKYENLVKSTIKHMDNYEFNLVSAETENFIWNDFCSNYIEFSKFNIESNSTKSTLCYVLTGIMKLLHPFMPFVTEEIYDKLPIKDSESIMISEYPKYNEEFIFDTDLDEVISLITKIRRIKLEKNIKDFVLVHNDNIIQNNIELISKILKVDIRNHCDLNTKEDITFNNGIVSIYYDGTANSEKEKENLLKEKEKLEQSINRRTNLLNNENYVNKAPINLVEKEKQTLVNEKKDLELINQKLEKMFYCE